MTISSLVIYSDLPFNCLEVPYSSHLVKQTNIEWSICKTRNKKLVWPPTSIARGLLTYWPSSSGSKFQHANNYMATDNRSNYNSWKSRPKVYISFVDQTTGYENKKTAVFSQIINTSCISYDTIARSRKKLHQTNRRKWNAENANRPPKGPPHGPSLVRLLHQDQSLGM